MPIFRVKSVKIYTGQKNLHGRRPRVRDKYEVCRQGGLSFLFLVSLCFCMLPFIFCFLTLKQGRQGYIFLVYMLKMAFLVVF